MLIGRREMLSMLVVQAARLRAQSRLVDPQQRPLFDLQKVSRHVWIALARPAALLNCNAVIFELFDGLLVVDTHSKPSAAAALVAQLRREVPAKPVRYVVNTHFHYDHAHGNAGYRGGTPGAVILASSETRRLLLERSGAFAASSVEGMKRTLATARARAGESPYWRQMALEAAAYIAEMSSFRPDLPDVTFSEGMVVHDRLQEVHLTFLGRAHTGSDICVWSPSEKVVATGDLLVGFVPGMGDGYPLEWPGTLLRLSDLEFDRVAPGHGDVQTGRVRLSQMRGYLLELVERVSPLVGEPLEEVLRLVDFASLRSLGGEFGEYLVSNTLRYRLMAPGTDVRAVLAAAVRGNVEAVYFHAKTQRR